MPDAGYRIVVEDWLYYNDGGLLQQLGFTLTPPERAAEEPSSE